MLLNNPKYVERYEDVVFELETMLKTTIANNARQKKDAYRIVVDNTGEVSVFDWFHARLSIGFKVTKTAGGNIAIDDHNGTVNGSHSLIHNLSVKVNGKQLYDCNEANHAVNIKNMLEYTPMYAQSLATNEFFYVDTNKSAEERPAQAQFNKGFQMRKAVLGLSTVVNTEIPLNRYSFFQSLEDKVLPNTRVELNFDLESDGNMIWQAADDCRVIVTRLQLFVPRVVFNSEGQTLYMSQYLKPHRWTYLRENIERSNSSTQRAGNFVINSGINKPRHVFVFIINDASIDNQTANPFLYDTFSVSTDPRSLVRCHLEIGNGIRYPSFDYTPTADLSRVYRNLLQYTHNIAEYQSGSLLSINSFRNILPIIYFDLTHQKTDIKDGVTKLIFKYELSDTTTTAYSIYALTLYEQNIELYQTDGKILIRS